jgi:adenine-specific DNA-methyltransferase
VAKYLIFFPKGWSKKNAANEKSAWNTLSDKYPAVAKFLKPHEEACRKRSDQGDYWWELRACDYYNDFDMPKIIWPENAEINSFALTKQSIFLDKTCFFMPVYDKYLLGILNSKLMWFFIKHLCNKIRGGWYAQQAIYIRQLPIIDISDVNIKKIFENRVDQIIEIVQQSKASGFEDITNKKNIIINNQIDELVYKLYGLTPEEIKIVEESVKCPIA